MASSEVQICNLGLVHAGIRQTIASLSEDTTEALIANAAFEMLRDALLEEYPWRFATVRADLSAIADGERGDWSYAYSAPADMLRALCIEPGSHNPHSNDLVEFEVEGDTTHGRIILCDDDDPTLVYIRQVTEVAWFSPQFALALSWRLASTFVASLKADPQIALAFDRKAELQVQKAFALDSSQRHLGRAPDSEFISVR